MGDIEWLSGQFEANRSRLRGLAYRMLGSLAEADDAVQECWLRLGRMAPGEVGNLAGWLTTVVSRICLDMLRSRKARREEPLEMLLANEPADGDGQSADPAEEAVLADSVGLAMLVVLGKLSPAERIAFVLHDIFAVSFDEIASIVGKSEAAARQLASRARRRVQGTGTDRPDDVARKRELVDAFLAASRNGDIDALLAVLDPDVVLRDERPTAAASVTRGSAAVARQVSIGRAQGACPVLVNGEVGIVVAPSGRLMFVIEVTFKEDAISEFDLIADPARLRRLELTAFKDGYPNDYSLTVD